MLAAVDDQSGSRLKNLETALPVRFLHSPVNVTVVNNKAAVYQYFYGSKGKGGIFNLVLTWKRAIQSFIIFADSTITKAPFPRPLFSYIPPEPVKLRLSFPACLIKNLQNRFLFCRRDAYTFVVDNPRLFPRYVSQPIPQIFTVLKRNV